VVPRCRLSTLGPRAFSVAGLSLWNSLPDSLRDPDPGRDNFRRLLKTHLFSPYTFSVLEMFQDKTLYTLTYLFTFTLQNEQESIKESKQSTDGLSAGLRNTSPSFVAFGCLVAAAVATGGFRLPSSLRCRSTSSRSFAILSCCLQHTTASNTLQTGHYIGLIRSRIRHTPSALKTAQRTLLNQMYLFN